MQDGSLIAALRSRWLVGEESNEFFGSMLALSFGLHPWSCAALLSGLAGRGLAADPGTPRPGGVLIGPWSGRDWSGRGGRASYPLAWSGRLGSAGPIGLPAFLFAACEDT